MKFSFPHFDLIFCMKAAVCHSKLYNTYRFNVFNDIEYNYVNTR